MGRERVGVHILRVGAAAGEAIEARSVGIRTLASSLDGPIEACTCGKRRRKRLRSRRGRPMHQAQGRRRSPTPWHLLGARQLLRCETRTHTQPVSVIAPDWQLATQRSDCNSVLSEKILAGPWGGLSKNDSFKKISRPLGAASERDAQAERSGRCHQRARASQVVRTVISTNSVTAVL